MITIQKTISLMCLVFVMTVLIVYVLLKHNEYRKAISRANDSVPLKVLNKVGIERISHHVHYVDGIEVTNFYQIVWINNKRKENN